MNIEELLSNAAGNAMKAGLEKARMPAPKKPTATKSERMLAEWDELRKKVVGVFVLVRKIFKREAKAWNFNGAVDLAKLGCADIQEKLNSELIRLSEIANEIDPVDTEWKGGALMRKDRSREKSMLSISDLQNRFSISYAAAYALMQTLPCINIAPQGAKYKTLRVSAWAVEQYEKQRRCGAWG